jgi:hypothetical protein
LASIIVTNDLKRENDTEDLGDIDEVDEETLLEAETLFVRRYGPISAFRQWIGIFISRTLVAEMLTIPSEGPVHWLFSNCEKVHSQR